jgi:hypothetical protein
LNSLKVRAEPTSTTVFELCLALEVFYQLRLIPYTNDNKRNLFNIIFQFIEARYELQK